MGHYLPTKVPSYLLRLSHQYARKKKDLERDLIATSRVYVIEESAYDNWNGGTYGHDVQFFLPIEELAKVDIDDQADVAKGICDDLNKLAQGAENEFFNGVLLDVNDENDPNFQRAISFSSQPVVDPDKLEFWKPGLVRLFISHRDQYKTDANGLAEALVEYGISSFVAHDTIMPMSEWRKEIMKGLETMEVMLVFLTDDLEDSIWINQEVGFALGKPVPIISLKLGHRDPPGFLSHVQALKGHIDNPYESAKRLFPLIGEALGKRERLQEVLVNAFVAAQDFNEAKTRFERMASATETLTEQQLQTIIKGFYRNDQLHNAGHLTSKFRRLENFLKRATGKDFLFDGRMIRIQDTLGDDEIPF